MRYILFVLSLLVFSIVLLLSCKKKEDKEDKVAEINDYLPLKVGVKYKYNYSASYSYVYENSIKKGECTWTIISKSVDTLVVYQVEQSFSGYNVYQSEYTGKKDSAKFENQISTLRFEVLNDGNVSFIFHVPYWGESTVTLVRFIKSEKIDTCLAFSLINRGCLRKNVGITNFFYHSGGNHSSSVSYSLIEGPYY